MNNKWVKQKYLCSVRAPISMEVQHDNLAPDITHLWYFVVSIEIVRVVSLVQVLIQGFMKGPGAVNGISLTLVAHDHSLTKV